MKDRELLDHLVKDHDIVVAKNADTLEPTQWKKLHDDEHYIFSFNHYHKDG